MKLIGEILSWERPKGAPELQLMWRVSGTALTPRAAVTLKRDSTQAGHSNRPRANHD